MFTGHVAEIQALPATTCITAVGPYVHTAESNFTVVQSMPNTAWISAFGP